MNKIYNHLLEGGYRLDNEEYSFNLARVRSLLDKDDPTHEELEELPSACLEYFEWYDKLNAAKALRRWRKQAARTACAAEEPPRRFGPMTKTEKQTNPEYDLEFDDA